MKLVILSALVIVACGFPFPQSFPFLELTSNLRDTFRNFLNGTLSRSNSTNFLSFGFENVTFNTSRFQRFLNRTLTTTPFLHELGNPVGELTCLSAEQRTALKPCENSSVNTCQPACALKQAGAVNLASIITSTNLTTAQKNASMTCLNKCLALNVTGVVNTLQAVFKNVTGTSMDPSCVVAGAAASCVLQALLKNGCSRYSRFGALMQAPEEDQPVKMESLHVELGQLMVQGNEPASESLSEENEDVAEAQAQVGVLAFLKAYSNSSESESEEGSVSSSEEEDTTTTTTATRVKRAPKAADNSNSTGIREFGEDLDFEDTYVENGGSDTNVKPSNGTGRPDDRQRGGSQQGTGNTDKARGNGRSANSRRGGNHGGEQRGGGRGRGHGKHGRNCTTSTTTTTTDATATEADAETTVDP